MCPLTAWHSRRGDTLRASGTSGRSTMSGLRTARGAVCALSQSGHLRREMWSCRRSPLRRCSFRRSRTSAAMNALRGQTSSADAPPARAPGARAHACAFALGPAIPAGVCRRIRTPDTFSESSHLRAMGACVRVCCLPLRDAHSVCGRTLFSSPTATPRPGCGWHTLQILLSCMSAASLARAT